MATAPVSHISNEEENYLRMNLLLTRLSPKAVRVFFNKEFPPTCLYATIEKELNKLKYLREKDFINLSQWSLLFPSNGVPDSQSFDVKLMITLIRNLVSLPAPVSVYNQLPLSTETTPTDDLTRIEYYKNKMTHFEDGQMGSAYFTTAWEDISGAIGRLGGPDMVAECEELRTKRLYHSTEHSEITITHIADDDSENIKRYLIVSRVIMETFQNILRDIIRSNISANKLYQMCLIRPNYFSSDQKTILNDLQLSNSYDSLNIPLIYKVLRQFSLISPPTKGWGSSPDKGDLKLADDVERIRHYRNQLVYRCNINIGKDEFDDYFDKFRDIGYRMDLHFFQTTNYERLIISHMTCSMDMEMQTKYKNAFAELEKIKSRFERTPIKFFGGDSFERSLNNLRSVIKNKKEEGEPKVCIQIILQDKDDVETTLTDIFNSLKEEIYENIVELKFTLASKDSVKLNEDKRSMFESIVRLNEDKRSMFERSLLTTVIECDGHVIDCDLPCDLNNSTNLYKQATQGFLLTAVIECDGHVIDCDVPHYLLNSKSVHKNAAKDQPQFKSTTSFTTLLLLHKEGTKHTNINKEFENCILSDESMVCRYILAHFQNHFDSIDMLRKGLLLAMENKKPNCAKAIGWEICRLYARTVSITQYYDIWPGFECDCNSQNTSHYILFCSCNVVIVAEVHKMEIISPQRETFHGIQIMYKEVNGHSEEAKSLMEEVDNTLDARKPYETFQAVSAEKATVYFDKHSKLTMISKSHLKSKGFCKENKKIERVPCIQLFCRAKGIVPIGESHFPDKIGSVQTDIFEGYPRLQAKQIRIGTEFFVPTEEQNYFDNGQNAAAIPNNEDEEMDIADDVNISFKGKAGTIGGFLKFHGEDAFLTCAHVIFSPEFLISHTFGSELHENPVKAYCKDENSLTGVIPCGHLASFTFPPNEINGSSIDAAIIRVDRNHVNIYMDDTERRELKSNYLQKCCLDWQEVGANTDFEIRTFGAVSLDQHIKDRAKIIEEKTVAFETLYQAVANVYRDINRANVQDNIHFAVQAINIVSKRHSDLPKSDIFRNQIAMNKIKFQQGDSGMCIYVRHNDGKFWCIGMAIATHPAGGCIITPLKAILKPFNY